MKAAHAELLKHARQLLCEAAINSTLWGLESTARDIADARDAINRVLREDPVT